LLTLTILGEEYKPFTVKEIEISDIWRLGCGLSDAAMQEESKKNTSRQKDDGWFEDG
jgi:hypothetical protein